MKTAQRAIHPRPLEIFGTKLERRNAKRLPATELKSAAEHHAIILVCIGFIPFVFSTSESEPVILIYNPYLDFFKK